MAVVTAAEFEALKASGWNSLDTTYDISYKSHWTMWHVIREFMQNALDEHDDAGISALPTLKRTPQGLLIADQGRGLGAEALLLRETKRASGAATVVLPVPPLVLATTNRFIGPHFEYSKPRPDLTTPPRGVYTESGVHLHMAENGVLEPAVEQGAITPGEAEKPEARSTTLSVRVPLAESERVRKLVSFAYELGIIPEKTVQALLLRGINHVYNEVQQAYREMRDGRR